MHEGFRGYNFSRPFQGERVPQHVQNLVIRDFAARRGLTYLLSATEYAMADCFMMLEQVLAELPSIEGMICYSIFQLPSDAKARRAVYDRVLASNAILHGAVEGLTIEAGSDIAAIEDIWRVRQVLGACPTAADFADFL
jgi:sporadic carbohydrate cluster protein (TIGR04323 family)